MDTTYPVSNLPKTDTGSTPAARAVGCLTAFAEGALSALNGIAGDHIAELESSMAIPMRFYHQGRPLALTPEAIRGVHPQAGSKAVVFVHGLCCNEQIWRFRGRRNRTYGALLQRDLGYTPFFVRYNTGLHVSENGRNLCTLLEDLIRAYPGDLEEIVLVGHSKGGLVIRSACHAGRKDSLRWPGKVGKVIMLGSPHLGAPLEKAANIFTWALRASKIAVAKNIGDFINFRSAAIKDLRFGYTREQEWRGKDPDALMENYRRSPHFLPGTPHYVAAAALTKNPRHLATQCLGDILVRIPSALGESHPGIAGYRVFTKTNHLSLCAHNKVYWQIRDWCQESRPNHSPFLLHQPMI